MRAAWLIGVAVLGASACSAGSGPDDQASQQATGKSADTSIECALAGASAFTRDCEVERAPQGDTLFLVVRHPDGGFRRFEVLKDGRGLAVADGAQEAQTAMAGERLEVSVGADRYRFPARQAAHAAP